MKRIITIILVMALMLILIFSCTACYSCNPVSKKDDKLYTEDFVYDIVMQEIFLYRNTVKSLEKDYLVIPDEIDGYPVTYVSYIKSSIYKPKLDKYTNILKKLYVSKNVSSFDSYDQINYSHGLKVIFLGAYPPKKMHLHTHHYISEYFLSNYNEKYPRIDIDIANVSYLYNFDEAPNQNVYFVDILEENESFSYIPEEPFREGHAFIGWFWDEACMNSVDLNTFQYTAENGNITFYAGWQEIKHQEEQTNE